jgi:hypothetical protein
VSGRNAVDYLVNTTSEGLSYAREDVSLNSFVRI